MLGVRWWIKRMFALQAKGLLDLGIIGWRGISSCFTVRRWRLDMLVAL